MSDLGLVCRPGEICEEIVGESEACFELQEDVSTCVYEMGASDV